MVVDRDQYVLDHFLEVLHEPFGGSEVKTELIGNSVVLEMRVRRRCIGFVCAVQKMVKRGNGLAQAVKLRRNICRRPSKAVAMYFKSKSRTSDDG